MVIANIIAGRRGADKSLIVELLDGTLALHVVSLPPTRGVSLTRLARKLVAMRVNAIALSSGALFWQESTIGIAVGVFATRGQPAVRGSVIVILLNTVPAGPHAGRRRRADRHCQHRQTEQQQKTHGGAAGAELELNTDALEGARFIAGQDGSSEGALARSLRPQRFKPI